MQQGQILLVDDEPEIRGFLQDYFEDRDYRVLTACDGEDGLEIFSKNNFDLIVCDMLMPKMIGMEFLRQVKAQKPEQRVIFMTGVKEPGMIAKAEALGCLHYLTKPIRLSELEAKVAQVFKSSHGS